MNKNIVKPILITLVYCVVLYLNIEIHSLRFHPEYSSLYKRLGPGSFFVTLLSSFLYFIWMLFKVARLIIYRVQKVRRLKS